VRIAFGRGVCGRAAEQKQTIVVDDVSKETNYLSCSVNVKSEIVAPIFKDGDVVAELDVDSHTVSAFSQADRVFLEDVCARLAELF